MNENFHTVIVSLRAEPSKENKVWLDGVKLKKVTGITLTAGVGDMTKVTITFFANVTGTFEEVEIPPGMDVR